MSYTIKNLREVEDVAPRFGFDTVQEDGEVVELRRLDAVRVAPRVARAFAAGEDGLELLVFGPHHDGDGEILDEDPWG